MLRLILFIGVLTPLMAISQMNMAKLAAQFPELKMPYETPADMPPNMAYWDEDPDLSTYNFIKSEVTTLFEENYGMEDEMSKYYSVGKISQEKYTAVIYVLMEISRMNGALSYRLFLDTYLKNGEQITSQELRSSSDYNIHEYEMSYDGPQEYYSGERMSRIFEIAGNLYLETTESSQTIRSIILNTVTYDEADLLVQKQSQTQVYLFSPDGKLKLQGDN